MKHRIASLITILVLFAFSPTALFAFGAASVTTTPSAAPASLIVSHAWGDSAPACVPTSMCPRLLETAYNFTGLHAAGVNGSGQSIAIVDACGNPNIASDLKVFDSAWKLPAAKLHVYYPQGTCSTDYGWGLEISLDVEWAHAIAPAATINLVVANQPTFGDLFGAWTYVLNHKLGAEISNSWGSTSPTSCSVNSILKSATSKGVTVLASTGDSGAWGSGTPGQTPANCEQVLGVGGTSLSVSSTGKYLGESAWGGGGGGYVSGVKEPTYQKSVAIKDPSHLLGKSDVSADANPGTGVLVYNSNEYGGWVTVGGTSVACPLWAAFLADANQIRVSNGFVTAGFVSPFLYTFVYGYKGTSSLYGPNFHDIKVGSNGYPAGKGWDVPTGLGSFKANALAFTIGNNKTA
jgi:subtilase family serine protease